MFKPRISVVENMVFIAIISAITIILSLLTALFPPLGGLISLIIPLAGTLVAIYCKARYYPLYIVVTLGLCLVVTMFNIQETLFYIVPAMLTGLIFGLLSKRQIHHAWGILICSLIQLGFNLLSVPLIEVLFQMNMINFVKSFLNLTQMRHVDIIIPLAIFMYSLIQFTLSYLIITPELQKISRPEETIKLDEPKYFAIANITAGLALVALAFIVPYAAYLFLGISIFLTAFLVYDYIKRKKVFLYIYLGGALFLVLGLFLGLFSLIPPPYSLLLFGAYGFLISFPSFFLHDKKPSASEEN